MMTEIKRKCFQKIKEEPQWQREQILRFLHRQRGRSYHYAKQKMKYFQQEQWAKDSVLNLQLKVKRKLLLRSAGQS